MKTALRRLLPVAALLLLIGTGEALSQSGNPAPGVTASQVDAQTIIGRINKLDTKAGLFSVRAASGKVVDLRADQSVDTKALRRGERVIVTYSAGVATKVQATRSEK